MPKIVVHINSEENKSAVINTLSEAGYYTVPTDSVEEMLEIINSSGADIMIFEALADVKETSLILRKIRLQDQSGDIQIILLTPPMEDVENIASNADGYISSPINQALLISTVNSHLRLKEHLDIFSANNSELAKRFYQLKVLYDTNSNLAGTLDKKKLINIMNKGLRQSISYSLCSTLVINNEEDVSLIINSIFPITKRLEQALKLRAIISYKSLFPQDKLPFDINIEKIKTSVYHKQTEETYDLEVMNFSNIFSPIATSDKFFGTVEIMRDSKLSTEDMTCFQTVVSQVALPLESAILYEEIQEKNVKLEKLEKLKSEFVSIVSHELRTPLTAIKNSLDIMLSGKSGELTDKMSNFLNMGKRNVVRLSGIINDLLDLSKIEAGKMEYRFEKMDLSEPISLIFSTFDTLATQREITLQVENNLQDNFVFGDTQKIEQILSNLVSNAIKFTGQNGNIKIKLSKVSSQQLDKKKFIAYDVNQVDLSGNYYKIDVQDTGIGISEENQLKVFDKFRQIESSLSRKVGGTGLGLPIAKEFVDAHKGFIWVESEENKGTTFSFIIPEYTQINSFLIELENLYQKANNQDFTFAVIHLKDIKNNNLIDEFLAADKTAAKKMKIFNIKQDIYIIFKGFIKNQLDVCIENFNNFMKTKKDAKIKLNIAFFDENLLFNEFLENIYRGEK